MDSQTKVWLHKSYSSATCPWISWTKLWDIKFSVQLTTHHLLDSTYETYQSTTSCIIFLMNRIWSSSFPSQSTLLNLCLELLSYFLVVPSPEHSTSSSERIMLNSAKSEHWLIADSILKLLRPCHNFWSTNMYISHFLLP